MTSRFSIVPADAFLDARLTPADVRVLGVLGSYLDKLNECFPSQGRVAEDARLNRSTVNRSLKKLVDMGYVICRQKYPGKVRSVLIYRVELNQAGRAFAEAEQPELFPAADFGGPGKPTKSDVALSNMQTPEIEQNQMLPKATSEKSDVLSGGHNVVLSREHTKLPNITPHSSVSKETGLSAAEDDSEEVAPASSHELKKSVVFNTGRLLLCGNGVSKTSAGRFLGRLVKDYGLDACFAAVTAASREPPGDPQAWLIKAAEFHARKLGRTIPKRLALKSEPEVDWDAVVDLYVRKDRWPEELGDKPDEPNYRGPIAPLEAIMANGKFGQLNVAQIRQNIDRVRAQRAA